MAIAVLVALFSVNSTVQSGTTFIAGTIFDQQGQVILSAAVILTSVEKGFLRTAATNHNGAFVFPTIQPGIYRLELKAKGFKEIYPK